MTDSTKKPRRKRLLVCVNPLSGPNKPCCGGDRGSEALAKAIERGIADRRIDCRLDRIHCLNKCHHGPAMRIAPGGAFKLGVTADDVPGLLDELQRECGTAPDEDGLDFGGFFPGG